MESIVSKLTSGELTAILQGAIYCLFALVAVYFSTRAKKSAEYAELNERFSEVLKQHEALQSASGRISHDFNIQALAFQIKMNRYEEKSIVAITSCYESAIALRTSIMDFFETSKTDEDIECVRQKIADFSTLLLAQTIWLPPPVLELFLDLHEDLKSQTSVYLRTFRVLRTGVPPDAAELAAIRQIQNDFFDLAVLLSERLAVLAGQISDHMQATMQKAPNQLSESPPTDSHTPAT